MKTITLARLVSLSVLLVGCSHYQWTYVRVEDAVSHEPLVSAKVTAGLYDPINPDTRRTRTMEVLTQTNGMAKIRIPMCSTRGVPAAYVSSGGVIVGRADLNEVVGPEVIAENAGYQPWINYTPNALWRIYGERSSLESPYVVPLWRTATKPGGAANGSQPIRAETNPASSAAGSRR